jgi:4-hydroxy-tetrahydrodipicolinate reductase
MRDDQRKDGLDPLRVGFVGLGATGCAIAAILAARGSIEIVAAVDRDPAKEGRDLGELTGGAGSGVNVSAELDLGGAQLPEVVVVTIGSRVSDIEPVALPLLSAGVNVISLCEELAYPWWSHPEASKRLDEAGRRGGATVIATGCNPGFLTDTLPLVLSAGLASVRKLDVVRTATTWNYGPLLDKFGFGLTESEFLARRSEDIVGHLGFEQSLAMISAAIGLEPDSITVDPPEPTVIATAPRRGDFVEVPANGVAAVRQLARAVVDGNPVLSFEGRFGFFLPGDGIEGDRLCLSGDGREVVVTVDPGYESMQTTIAVCANIVAAVPALPPGLASMVDLPVGALAAPAA